ncbi:filamentous hemagglutinin N-terminal domain-containing protein [Magnetospirillum sp. 15-1]|uniref:beta strand repeat-containing protein n=1 Tax=Magnetospirillum sp. 15-1 TaxID=1979370 RepID=UPI0014820623|nr:filamentous hemagglutinin N-terminal domain-containing protein [Magnetospirillum sp. 15-1]
MMYSPPRRHRALKSSLRDRLPLTMTAAAALLVFSPPAQAAPQGGTVVSGAATITQSGNTTDINQSTGRAIINWQSFSIAAPETVNFHQPSSSSVTLNRVIGNEKSIIDGALNANGKVYLVNSAGVLIGKGASVNTAGLVASTLNIRDEDFNAGRNVFQSTGGTGEVTNLGTITVTSGGYVALLGKTVSNQGVISATKGTVTLGGGSKVTLNFNGDSLVSVSVDEGTLNALVENRQAIYADGGTVILTAKAADELLAAQVNNDGLIQARTIDDLKGSIQLYAHGGTANVAGTLDASAPIAGDGGFIETSGSKVKIADSAVITTLAATGKGGTWLIDPDGYTIAASGGDITGAALKARLASNGTVTIASTNGSGSGGNIDVNDAVNWTTDSVLTLTATNAINVNKAITADSANAGLTLNAGGNVNINAAIALTGANAALAINYGGWNGTTVTTPASGSDYVIRTKASYAGTTLDANGNPVAKQDTSGGVYGSVTLSGGSSSLNINGKTYTLIHSMADLATATSATKTYALAQDLEASGTTYSNTVRATLDGTLAGLGHTISNLTISSSTGGAAVGLIGQTTTGSLIRDVGLVNAQVSTSASGAFVGALVGKNLANISGAYSTGTVSGGLNSKAGGLIGQNSQAAGLTTTISDSFSEANVYGKGVGGLVGAGTNLAFYRSYSSGNVWSTAGGAGGLIGTAGNTSIYNSYHTTGSVKGATDSAGNSVTANVTYAYNNGGLIGSSASSTIPQYIENSYTSGDITGFSNLGGLIGSITATTANYTINNSYASVNVVGSQGTTDTQLSYPGIGGLIGSATLGSGTLRVTNSHAAGTVKYADSQGTAAGGLIGAITASSAAVIDTSYANVNVTGASAGSSAGGLIGMTSSRTTISNSYATGNVSGFLSVGGLVGNNAGTTTNSWASGNVVGAGNQVGGLAGANTGTITNSHASGSVTGAGAQTWTGGLVGSNSGTIDHSDFKGVVRGPSGVTGGIAGTNFNSGRIVESYFNSTLNSGLGVASGFVPTGNSAGVVVGGGGLTSEQFSDVQYYLDGTINQVLADRQKRSDATQQANALVAANIGKAPTTAAEVTGAAGGPASRRSSVDDKIAADSSSSYSVNIKSVEVDGVRFNLDEGEASGNRK